MPGRVLIVDDNQFNIRLLEAKLTSEYYEVISADNGRKALELARTVSPDIILLDIMMPEMDGFEVCEHLKSEPITAHIPVVMVTALSDSADRVRGLEAGADDFLSKPVRDMPLFARVRSLIRLKLLMDVWRVREETSTRLGLTQTNSLPTEENATGGKILVVEEDIYESANIEQALAADEHAVVLATTPDEAYAILNDDKFDLIIIALRLNDTEGLRLCSQIRAHRLEEIRSIPVLLIAEDDKDFDHIAKGFDLGINDYLVKPIEGQELLARVRTQLRRERYQARLRRNYEQSMTMASVDPLTNVYNRRYLDVHLDQMLHRADESNKRLSLAFCDIDHFKSINDTYGHAVGDAVLVEFCRRLMRNLRSFDLVARYGGEEFLVIMPDTAADRALQIAERLRKRLEEQPMLIPNVPSFTVTVSIGVTTNAPEDVLGADLVERADKAMYDAKGKGRNRVEILLGPGQIIPVYEPVTALADLNDLV